MVSLSDKFTLGRNVLICQDADLQGDITIGSGTILHPRCRIHALEGPIRIGDNCIIEERAFICNRRAEILEIGSNNVFEVACHIEAAAIGSYNTFEPKSNVPPSIAISDWCIIGAACTVAPRASMQDFAQLDDDPPLSLRETLPDHTVVYGSQCTRRTWSGEGSAQTRAIHAKHLLYLQEMLPRYNKSKQFPPGSAVVAGVPAF